jgi:arsenate reductase
MAEAFLKRYAGEYFDIYNAGFDPKPAHPLATKVMQEISYDISKQQSKDLRQLTRNAYYGIARTVCKKAEEDCPTIIA